MSIWRSTPPRKEDFPIWVLLYSEEEPTYCETIGDFPIGNDPVTWKQAGNIVGDEFQRLANSDISTNWRSSDWFKAGYEYALEDRLSMFNPSLTGSNTAAHDHYNI